MNRLKTFRKYIIWIIAFYLFSSLLIYIGLNSRYKGITNDGQIPDSVKINLAQATSVNGRILGEVTSTEANDLNEKYLKTEIFSKNNDLIGTKYLKLEDLDLNEPKKFAVYFQAENVKKYAIDIVENNEQTRKEEIRARDLYKKIFRNQDLPVWLIILLVVYALA